MFIAEAKIKDLDSLTWFTFVGARAVTLGSANQFNQRHTLQIKPQNIIGFKKVARGPGAGNYQVVLGHAPHVLFRNVPFNMIEKLQDRLEKYKGKNPTHPELDAGRKRAPRVVIEERIKSDKQKDDFYKPNGTINERTSYDRENYQWRKVISNKPIKIVTLKQGRSRSSIAEGDVIGLRYMTKARGGFIILPTGARVNISHDNFEEIVNSTRILPASRQQRGIVLVADVKSVLGKQDRIRKAAEPDAANADKKDDKKLSPIELAKQRLLREAKKKAFVPEPQEDLEDDFEDDEDDEDAEDDVPATSPKNTQTEQPDAETKHESHTPSILKVGSTIRSGRRTSNTFIVANVKDYGGYSEYALYNPETTHVTLVRFNNNIDLSRVRDLIILEDAPAGERAAAIRAYNKAAKLRKFSSGTIHDAEK